MPGLCPEPSSKDQSWRQNASFVTDDNWRQLWLYVAEDYRGLGDSGTDGERAGGEAGNLISAFLYLLALQAVTT